MALARRVFGRRWLKTGLTVLLEVAGRRTGAPHRVALFPVTVDGTSYLLSQYGATGWVRNLRAAGRGELSRKGRAAPFTAVEVDGAERDRVIAAFRAKMPRPFRRDFEQLPAAADHPAFRVEPPIQP
jgi:deazaflavin-dependent oxidoreductase (nitroreductase family)